MAGPRSGRVSEEELLEGISSKCKKDKPTLRSGGCPVERITWNRLADELGVGGTGQKGLSDHLTGSTGGLECFDVIRRLFGNADA